MTVQGFLDVRRRTARAATATRSKQGGRRARSSCASSLRCCTRAIDTLSKGYRHRTCLAQALIHDPEVLILDEPTDGLDPNQKHEVRNLIRELGKTKAIIFSTHILEEVDAACTPRHHHRPRPHRGAAARPTSSAGRSTKCSAASRCPTR